jgi:hypothetical protein
LNCSLPAGMQRGNASTRPIAHTVQPVHIVRLRFLFLDIPIKRRIEGLRDIGA